MNHPLPLDITSEVEIFSRLPIYSSNHSLVYEGTYRGRKIAAKALKHVEGKDMVSMKQKVLQEMVIWASLQHENIAQICGVVKDERFGPFDVLISPLYPNGNASKYLESKTLSFRARFELWIGVVQGVIYLHSHVPIVIHGYLKPANILINNQGIPKICGLGLTQLTSEIGSTGLASENADTVRYLSPELLARSTDCLPTTASDMYALGCIGQEFIFEKRPYHWYRNDRLAEITASIERGDPPGRRALSDDRRMDRLWDILSDCCSSNPTARPSAPEVIPLVQHWMGHCDHISELTCPSHTLPISSCNQCQSGTPRYSISQIHFLPVPEEVSASFENALWALGHPSRL